MVDSLQQSQLSTKATVRVEIQMFKKILGLIVTHSKVIKVTRVKVQLLLRKR